METSAKTGQNVELAFMAVARFVTFFFYFYVIYKKDTNL